jgi:hypothetical protein
MIIGTGTGERVRSSRSSRRPKSRYTALSAIHDPENTSREIAIMTSIPWAFTFVHELKSLPFDPAKLDGISEKLIRSHRENNYGGSVNALNAVNAKLASFLDDPNLSYARKLWMRG